MKEHHMNTQSNLIEKDFAAFKAKLCALGAYEKREEPSLKLVSETMQQVAESVEQFKSSYSGRIDDMARSLEQMQTRMARPGAFVGSALGADTQSARAPSADERKAFDTFLRTGERKAVVNVGTSGQGMEAAVTWFDDVVLRMARDQAPLLKIIRTRKVGSFPAKHIVSNSRVMGSGWTGEQGSRSDTDAPLPLVVEVQPGEWWAMPSITEWALTDLAFDAETWLTQELVDEYSETTMAAVVSGNGTNKPTGFLAAPNSATSDKVGRAFGTLQYFATGSAAALPSNILNMLLDVVHGTSWKHRQKASWVLNAATLGVMRKYNDTTGQPILIESTSAGMPTRLLGYPVVECEAMPDIAANAFPIAFGDFDAGYVLDEDREGMRITRDDITQKGFVKFFARRRIGGAVLDSEAIKLVKVATS